MESTHEHIGSDDVFLIFYIVAWSSASSKYPINIDTVEVSLPPQLPHTLPHLLSASAIDPLRDEVVWIC
jgi:hypothetical protein